MYFKNVSDKNGISFIPGINVDKYNKKAFIQVITKTSSYYINYIIDDFKFSEKPFYIKIKNNIFSKEGIHIDIKDNSQNIKIYGDIKYLNNKNIKTSNINPNIMGPFSYIPFKLFEFTGLICDIIINDKEFKFTTYNNAKIINYSIEDNLLYIILKKKDYFLEVKSKFDKGLKLTAPVKGKMQKDIFETILSNITVTLRLKNEIIFSDTSSNCGLEISSNE